MAATRKRERGALMIGVMAALAILMILSAVAAREWAQVVRRDNEAEMMFRAQDIVRALKRFQKDKGRLPNELKELTEPGSKGQYFIRKLWKDPLVKGGGWKLLYAGPQGGLVDPSQLPPGTPGAFGDDEDPAPQRRTFQSGEGRESSDRDEGQEPAAPERTLSAFGSSRPAGDAANGLPIAGVKTKCTEKPFRVYKQHTEYSEWVFSVFDLDPQQGAAPPPASPGGPNPGGPQPSSPGTSGTKQPTFPPR